MDQERGAFKVHCENRRADSRFTVPIGKQIRDRPAWLSLNTARCHNLNHSTLIAQKLSRLPLWHTFPLSK
jgi:hypothetical protein